jgi:hypothetical protein
MVVAKKEEKMENTLENVALVAGTQQTLTIYILWISMV